ncbi:MAG: diguanylate cyclase [Rhodoferax sp.]|uniref:sensor domain-containing diguanylate cyclase n=1 Tax=Rhodoferax sp. TaxID=50421 RepID=UPI00260CF058|nr:diguanylate cyclase [Rhodoferax sp.]MDD5333572.1 diguanylate cyclase [Rhodoferax sp.]
MFMKSVGRETLRLRVWFLLPLASVLVLATLILVTLIHLKAITDIDRFTLETVARAEHVYQDQVELEAEMLGAAMLVLANDRSLRQALARHDREQLLRGSATLFAELKKKHGITHLYFSDPNRVNILRVHEPERFGDTLNRSTTVQAQQKSQTVHGVELGPLGTFTLRLVTPWFDSDGKLLGLVELGTEIDHVLQAVQQQAGVKAFILIDKKFIDRQTWESGMRMLGREPDWNRFADVVLNLQANEHLPPDLVRGLQAGPAGEPQVVIPPAATCQRAGCHSSPAGGKKMVAMPVVDGSSAYRAVVHPLKDAAGRSVGNKVLLVDVSPEVETLQAKTLAVLIRESAWVGGISCVILLVFFYWLVGRVGQRLDEDQQRLRELADHDGLTGLFNHRMHYLRLKEEFSRGARTGKPISLLLLDLDHFKQVNDRYGHLGGDQVLKTISALVTSTCRQMDLACRYGGEEITVILPETAADAAMLAAERLRKIIETQVFAFEDQPDIHITVSIGVATSSEHCASATELTAGADRAMYRAKEKGRNRVERAPQQADQGAGG